MSADAPWPRALIVAVSCSRDLSLQQAHKDSIVKYNLCREMLMVFLADRACTSHLNKQGSKNLHSAYSLWFECIQVGTIIVDLYNDILFFIRLLMIFSLIVKSKEYIL